MALVTVGPPGEGHDYTSLHDALVAVAGTLTAPQQIACYRYADGTAYEDSTYINGKAGSIWSQIITSSANYLEVYVASGHEHDGTPGTGYILSSANDVDIPIYLNSDGNLNCKHVRFRGLAVKAARTSSGYNHGIEFKGLSGAEIDIEDCLVYCTTGGAFALGIWSESLSNSRVRLRNNIVIGFPSRGLGLRNDTLREVVVYSNTVVGCGVGYEIAYNIGGCYFRNNIGYNNTTDFTVYSNGGTQVLSNNLSKDATAPLGSEVRNTTLTFANAAASDYHLAGTDTAALGVGADLSAVPIWPFSTDIDGTTRTPGAWDIGADQYAGAAFTAGTATLGTVTTGADATVNASATDATGGVRPFYYQWFRTRIGTGTWTPLPGATSLTLADNTFE